MVPFSPPPTGLLSKPPAWTYSCKKEHRLYYFFDLFGTNCSAGPKLTLWIPTGLWCCCCCCCCSGKCTQFNGPRHNCSGKSWFAALRVWGWERWQSMLGSETDRQTDNSGHARTYRGIKWSNKSNLSCKKKKKKEKNALVFSLVLISSCLVPSNQVKGAFCNVCVLFKMCCTIASTSQQSNRLLRDGMDVLVGFTVVDKKPEQGTKKRQDRVAHVCIV